MTRLTPRAKSSLLAGVLVAFLAVMFYPLYGKNTPKATPIPVEVRGQVLIAPTPSHGPVPTPVGEVRLIKVGAVTNWHNTVSRLETQEYSITTDVVGKRYPQFQLGSFEAGGESIQAHLEGTVIGRTDFGKMDIQPDYRSGDIIISEDGTQISIVLPAPEISRPIPNEAMSSFNNHHLGWWGETDQNLWQAVRIIAASELMQQACRDGIRDQARHAAEDQVRTWFGLGFRTVYIQTKSFTTPCGEEAQ